MKDPVDPYWGTFWKKGFFAPSKCQTLVKFVKIQRLPENGYVFNIKSQIGKIPYFFLTFPKFYCQLNFETQLEAVLSVIALIA